MHRRKMSLSGTALAAASLALSAVPPALAGSGAPKVTVRVEGAAKTLVPATVVQPSGGVVTKDGHACSAQSGAGAFDKATKGNWTGTYSSSLSDFQVTKILGDTESYTITKSYWELFVDNVPASSGICGIKPLHPGEQILVAAVPATGTVHPIGISAPSTARVGRPLIVEVVAYDAKGRARPLAGATVAVGARTGHTGRAGTIKLIPSKQGRYTIAVAKKGFIRDAVTLAVRGA